MRPDKLIEQYEKVKEELIDKRGELNILRNLSEATEERIIKLLEIQEKAVVAHVELVYPTLDIRGLDTKIVDYRAETERLTVEIDEAETKCLELVELIKAEGWEYYRPLFSFVGEWKEIKEE